MKVLKVAVVMGGNSPEHDISLQSGATVLAHLPESKYERTAVVVQPSGSWCLAQGALTLEELSRLSDGVRPEEAIRKLRAWGIDAAFLALHGPNGEDGSVQGFFQVMGIPYTGSDVESSAITLNKYASKVIMAAWGGVLIPPYRLISLPDWEDGGEESLFPGLDDEVGFPAFVKPLHSGSSLGTMRIEKRDELKSAVEHGFLFDDQILFEREIPGRELTCGVLCLTPAEFEALPPVEIRPKRRTFFDFESKYNAEEVEEICPAPIPPEEREKVEKITLAICRQFRIRGICRVDFILNEEGLWFLELNAIPGFTPESIVLKEAAEKGIPLDELLDRLIESALRFRRLSGALKWGW